MAIKVVNSRYPGFIFDGENSRDYGVYITDVEVFGAPKRKVQMISIPGRNGDYALDEGSFENIPVKYTSVLGAGTEEDFNNGISDFRNWLASKVGYKVLSDEINLGEYRKGVFLEGMEVPTLNKKTGTFDIVFDCMPQRWLDDASALPVEMASGDDIFNPTLHKASPLLSVWGYGNIDINGELISIFNSVIGDVTLTQAVRTGYATMAPGDPAYYDFEINPDVIATGDEITFTDAGAFKPYNAENTMFFCELPQIAGRKYKTTPALSHTESGQLFTEGVVSVGYMQNAGPSDTYASYVRPYFLLTSPIIFAKGTPERKDGQSVWTIPYTVNGTASTATVTFNCYVDYDGAGAFEMGVDVTTNRQGFLDGSRTRFYCSEIIAYSNVSTLGAPLYFDLDIGEAYKEEGGEIISVNNAVSFPAKLPTLKPGHNTITFDNTVGKLVITPRWWKV